MISIRSLNPPETHAWVERCARNWEHGQIIPPITLTDIEKPSPEGITKSHLVVEEKDLPVAGLTVQMDEHANLGSYGAKYWLDLWVIEEKRGEIEEDIILTCDAKWKSQGAAHMVCRIPDHASRFTPLFEQAGYEPLYKEHTFIRETQAPLTDRTLSYYQDSQKKVHLRVSQNIQKDVPLYSRLLNEISTEIPNMSPLDRQKLHFMVSEGKKHMIGVWIFAEVQSEPAGFIGGLISIQQLWGTSRTVGNIVNNGVLGSFRGMGIGTALYVKMIEEMRKWNTSHILDYMVMEDNQPEQTLLKELGFTVAQTHVKMQKSLG
jgi:ribosomal protein S18 acetylase RimI-like enzyme